jgi:hypothetical protein
MFQLTQDEPEPELLVGGAVRLAEGSLRYELQMPWPSSPSVLLAIWPGV